MMSYIKGKRIKHRGTFNNPHNRYHNQAHEEEFSDSQIRDAASEDWQVTLTTEVQRESARTIINYYDSPDIPGDRSINPYRGCEHGCVYCFARPSHAYWDLSPGLDFETKLFQKENAVDLLVGELTKKRYKPRPIALGINTDAYQPIEKKYQLTRRILETLLACKHPVTLLTKSAVIERDIDLIEQLAKLNLVHVGISVTSLDMTLSRLMEPRAAPPARRLLTIERLAKKGVPVNVMMAPIIPFINDAEIETLLQTVKNAGATHAAYVMIRLPHEIKELFSKWLNTHFPDRANKVLNVIRDMHQGKLYKAKFGQRMTGSGQYSELIQQRFTQAIKRVGLNKKGYRYLETKLFDAEVFNNQMRLF